MRNFVEGLFVGSDEIACRSEVRNSLISGELQGHSVNRCENTRL